MTFKRQRFDPDYLHQTNHEINASWFVLPKRKNEDSDTEGRRSGCVYEEHILTAAQAEALGYEDDYRSSHAGHKLFVDGYDSLEAIHNYLSNLVNCTLVE